jgi:uncharacterized protein with HEPN domain
MQPNKLDVQSIWDMVDAIAKIQEFTIGMDESDYLENELVQSAVERKLEILGEAARRVSHEFQTQHAEIDWRNTIGLRNIIAHRYDQIDQERVWNIAQTVLPTLKDLLMPLLPPIVTDTE